MDNVCNNVPSSQSFRSYLQYLVFDKSSDSISSQHGYLARSRPCCVMCCGVFWEPFWGTFLFSKVLENLMDYVIVALRVNVIFFFFFLRKWAQCWDTAPSVCLNCFTNSHTANSHWLQSLWVVPNDSVLGNAPPRTHASIHWTPWCSILQCALSIAHMS
jgi:hypothetical protein